MNSTRFKDSLAPLPKLHESPYLTTYEWEKSFDLEAMRELLVAYWSWSIYASIIYVFVIFGIQYYMQDKKPFRLNPLLTLWNVGLAVFSGIVFTRTLPEFISVITSQNGHHNSLCHWTQHNYITAYWTSLFLISKLVELGDTVFIVLRKQKLIFLHWYHHIMTLVTATLMGVEYEPHQNWYVVLNSCIHTFMYSYFALKAAGVKVPRSWAMTLTGMQLVQMVGGLWVNVYAVWIMWIQGRESECARNHFGLKLSFGVATSYLFLFGRFFYMSYIKSKSLEKVPAKPNSEAALQTNNRQSTKKLH